jgi:signal transduction histidine kinase/CheY-like chemotaxis protein
LQDETAVGGSTPIAPWRVITLTPITRYVLALGAALVAIGIRVAFDPVWGTKLPFITMFPAIVLSAWLGGLWPGALTTAICAAAAQYLWLQPAFSWRIADVSDVIGLLLFVTIGLVISAVNEEWRRGASSAARGASELRQQAQLLQTTNDTLRHRTEELERVLEVIPAAVWIAKDPECHEVIGNPSAAALFGVPIDQNMSQTPGDGQEPICIRHFRGGRELSPSELPMQQAAASGRPQRNEEIDIELPNGKRLTIVGGAVPLVDEAGNVRGVVGTFSDITDRKQIEEERAQLLLREQAARAEIERASRVKDEFLAVLSHELRTPLNAVLGYAHLLGTDALSPERSRHAIAAIQRNAQAQGRLVESLLDLSRIMAGKLELDFETVDVSKLVDAAIDDVRGDADAKEITIDVAFLSAVPNLVGDGGRLQQVFWNLLTNAIKFTPRGGRIGVRVVQQDGELAIRVSDTGQGIPAAFLPHVFDRFKQADGPKGRSPTGLGLGLALVREMVQAHGGTVVAESAGDGQGSTFTVTLPFSATAPPRPARMDLPDATMSSLPGLDILIVDDDGDVRDLFGLLLESRGATVRAASSAAEALETIARRSPDVVLADVGMPEEDGYSLIRKVRAREQQQTAVRLPAIAVTSYAAVKDRERAIAEGYDSHVAKPVDPDALVRAITKVAIRQEA